MTVSYSLEVSSSKLCTFGKLLFRWRGSIYRIVWREVLAFLVMYYAINVAHRVLMTQDQRNSFEKFCIYCGQYLQRAPLTFVLAFYIGITFQRWWDQFQCIAWPDRLAMYLGVYIRDLHPGDKNARMLRRSIIRYLNLASVLALRTVSTAVKKRFPTMNHLVESGLMNEEELNMYEGVISRETKEYIPLQWAESLLYRSNIEVNDFRGILRRMMFYDWISVPLVYTQVVTIAVYAFFFATVFAAQRFSTPGPPTFPSFNKKRVDVFQQYALFEVDLYCPVFTILEIVIYVGWLKVAEVLINPFGEDEDDFEVNYIIERNLEVSYIMADDNYDVSPTLKPDMHWLHKRVDLLHTAASYGLQDHRFLGSTEGMRITDPQSEIVVGEEGDNYSSVPTKNASFSSFDSFNVVNGFSPTRTCSYPTTESGNPFGQHATEAVKRMLRSLRVRRLSTRKVTPIAGSTGSDQNNGDKRNRNIIWRIFGREAPPPAARLYRSENAETIRRESSGQIGGIHTIRVDPNHHQLTTILESPSIHSVESCRRPRLELNIYSKPEYPENLKP